MFEIRTSLSPDLARLEADGLRLRVVQGDACHLLIEGIPAVNSQRQVVKGTLYSPLEVDPTGKTVNPVKNHQCWWIADEPPYDSSGQIMNVMISNNQPEDKGDNIRTRVAFSRKRAKKTEDYADYHEKIWAYIEMIWHEAQVIDSSCTPRGDKPMAAVVEAQQRVFRYPDMATTRAGIGAATSKLLLNRVAIIGVGGTGSYILDLVAKTPVAQIHIFDGAKFKLHNAFRAPGAPSAADFTLPNKVDWFFSIYDRMHSAIVRHPYHVGADQINELEGFDFVFVSVDDAEARKIILEGLIGLKIPFIDVGMDIGLDGKARLDGMCRFTVGTPDRHSHIYEVLSLAKTPDDEVYRNIQVADLNMLNAALAVGKWKKLCDFYADDAREHHSTYTTATHTLTKEDLA